MSLLHHPAFESLVLPALLAVTGVALLRALPAAASRRWTPLGAVVALPAALAVLPGFAWPAAAIAQKLPWVVLLALALAALVQALSSDANRAGRWLQWLVAALCWAGASVWLAGGRAAPLAAAATVLSGAAVLALLAWGDGRARARQHRPVAGDLPPLPEADTGAALAAALAVAALGLAAVAAGGGSLLLAQLALMLATVTAVAGLWTWLRPASSPVVSSATLMPLGLAWLAIAQALPTLTGAGVAPLALVALAFLSPLLVARRAWAGRRPRRVPAAVALLAAVPVALAVAWQPGAGGTAADIPGAVDDDPYYEPRWQ